MTTHWECPLSSVRFANFSPSGVTSVTGQGPMLSVVS